MIVNAFNEVNWDIFKKGVGFSYTNPRVASNKLKTVDDSL
jgi:hypothetical protein